MTAERVDWYQKARELGRKPPESMERAAHGQTTRRAPGSNAAPASSDHLERERSPRPKGAQGRFRAQTDEEMEAREGEGSRDFPPPERRGFPLEAKRRVVVMFAQYQRLKDIRAMLATEFGISPDERSVARLNPEHPKPVVGQALRKLFDAAREAYVRDITRVGVASQAHRLRALERLAEKAEENGQISVALQALKQAAEEVGGLMTNTKNIKHEAKVEHRHLSVDDARAELVMRLGGMLDGGIIVPDQQVIEHKPD